MTNHAAETFSTKHRRFRIADRDTLRKFRSKNPLSGSLVLGLELGVKPRITYDVDEEFFEEYRD